MTDNNNDKFTVKELIAHLEKENPDAEVSVYYDDEIDKKHPLMPIGGNSFSSGDVRIMTVRAREQLSR